MTRRPPLGKRRLAITALALVVTVTVLTGCEARARGAPENGIRSEAASSSRPSARPSTTSREGTPTPKVTSSRPPRRPPFIFRGMTVGIDPGHNGLNHTRPDTINRPIRNGRGDDTEACNTTGTETNGGYPESRFTFNVATELALLLRAHGARVVMTRISNKGVGPCVDDRARIINSAHADVAIDIHADGGPTNGRGFAVLEPVSSGTNNAVVAASLRYAKFLRSEFLATGMPTSTYDGMNGFKKRPDLGGLNLTTVPQLLLECGNMRNAIDARLLTSSAFQHAAARAILRAMRLFLISQRRR